MPRTSMLESLLSQAATPRPGPSSTLAAPDPLPGTALAAGASHLVEASTTEEALAELGELLGPDARIIDARRVRRGGVGGFFAKEIVQLHATTGDRAQADVAPPLAERPTSTQPSAVAGRPTDVPERAGERPRTSPVDRLLADAEGAPEDMDFATYLQGHLSAGRGHEAPNLGLGATPTGPDALATQPLRSAPAPVPTSRDDAFGVAPWLPPVVDPRPASSDADELGWSRDALLRLGLPVELVRAVDRASPTDDVSWTMALTEAVRPSCRPLPGGPCVLVGPRAHHLGVSAEVGDVEVARSRTWLAALRPGRWVHLVVGGDGWRRSLDDEPLVVSWSRDADLPDALRCAVELGLVLGFGPGSSGPPRRARPLEVALAVRELVVGR